MTRPLTPREKVAEIVRDGMSRLAASQAGARPVVSASKEADRVTDAILTALASGSGDQLSGNPGILKSGDHAELARLAEAAKRVLRDANGRLDGDDAHRIWFAFLDAANPATVLAILAEIAALRVLADDAAKHSMRQTDKLLAEHDRATEAERKLAEAVGALKEIAAIEPKPFDGGLDMEAIRACDECQRYAGHPVQQGICNTHRRPLWDREKHESHEEKALGYRAKSIARTFLSKEAERG